MTVPVCYHYPEKISEVKINNTVRWREKHWQALVTNYSRAPYFHTYADFFRDTFDREWDLFGYNFDQSTSARISDWKNGLRDWLKNHFLFGYGVTGYSFMDAQYVKVAVETGIIGLIAFVLLITAIFKHTWLSYKNVQSPFFKGLSLGYIAGLVGLIFHSLGTNAFIIVRIMEPFWFLTGMVIMLPELENTADEDDSAVQYKELPFLIHS